MHELPLTDSTLRSATEGAKFAAWILDKLAAGESVRLDFEAVEIMTPSFANTLVMTLLERHDLDTLRARCEFVNRSPHVVQAMNRAVERFQSGIRLSSQLAAT